MRKLDRYRGVLRWFQTYMPVAETELNYNNAFELLVAVILSAQCTDKRVNQVTGPLFKAFPTAESLANSTPDTIFEYIQSVSYPNSKSKYLVQMAKKLVKTYSGEVPSNLEELVKLPGVGRKTANVILSIIFGQPAMAVDTHVFRVANRIGLTKDSKTPLETEMELVKNIPKKYISKAHHWLILHGRYTCQARLPKCDQCGLQPWCKYYLMKK